jgi:hypothetical protein
MRYDLLALGVVAVAVAAYYTVEHWDDISPPVDTSPEAFARIEKGRTCAEVEAILGAKSGSYGSDVRLFYYGTGDDLRAWQVKREWQTNDASIVIVFSRGNGTVEFTSYTPKQNQRRQLGLDRAVWAAGCLFSVGGGLFIGGLVLRPKRDNLSPCPASSSSGPG